MPLLHPAQPAPVSALARACTPPRPGRGIRLDEFVAAVYLPYHQLHKRSWQVDERIARQHLSPFFGARRMADIRTAEVLAWQRRLTEKDLAPSTCNRILAVFKAICTMAVAQGALRQGGSPCQAVPPLKTPPLPDRHLSKARASRLMQVLRHSDKAEAAALRLIMLTGCRKSEILRAQWQDVRLDLRLLIVPVSKSGKPRYVALCDEAVEVLRSLPRQSGSPWLFPGHAPGKPLSDIYHFWNKLRCELGLQGVRVHDLRHTFASFLVNAGHSLYEVQQLLGHADPRTTMRYAHLDQASLLAAAETVSRCLSPEPTAKQTAAPLPRVTTVLPEDAEEQIPEPKQDETTKAMAPITEGHVRPQQGSRQARYTASKAGPFILVRTGRGSTRPHKQKKALPNTTGRSTGRGQ